MSNYRRLISYIYAYEGGVKGKNIGFAKLEARNGQCKIQVNVKKVYVGGNDLGVYLLSGAEEISLGKIFIRNGAGEFRTIVQVTDVEHSGCTMDSCYGLTIHDMENSWQTYTTIWEDAVAHAAEVELGDITSENRRQKEAELEMKYKQPEESVDQQIPEPELQPELQLQSQPEPQPQSEPELPSEPQLPPEPERQPESQPQPQPTMRSQLADWGIRWDGKGNAEDGKTQPPSQTAPVSRQKTWPRLEPFPGRESQPNPYQEPNPAVQEPVPVREPNLVQEPGVTPALPEPELEELSGLPNMEEEESSHQDLWNQMRTKYPKIFAFEYANGCEILTIKPQDIGLLPREIWVYGNNSFLLHGYYNYRYLILVKLNNPEGADRYLLGVPGHYYNSEKYMASMFGFPHFVLSKEQPMKDGRFGYWYTDIRLEHGT